MVILVIGEMLLCVLLKSYEDIVRTSCGSLHRTLEDADACLAATEVWLGLEQRRRKVIS